MYFKYLSVITLAFFLSGCGPSEEEMRAKIKEEMKVKAAQEAEKARLAKEQANTKLVNNWKKVVSDVEKMQLSDDPNAKPIGDGITTYMLDNDKGILFEEFQLYDPLPLHEKNGTKLEKRHRRIGIGL